MEIIGLFVHLETVAVTAAVFLFCSQVELVFHISRLQGANESGHSALPPPPKDTCPSEGWVTAGIRHTQPQQALGHGRLAPFSLPVFHPLKPGLHWMDTALWLLHSREKRAKSLVFTQSSHEHPRDPLSPFKAVRTPGLLLFSHNFLLICLYVSTYFYTNNCVEDLLVPELAKQTNHRAVTLQLQESHSCWGRHGPCILPACEMQSPYHTRAME